MLKSFLDYINYLSVSTEVFLRLFIYRIINKILKSIRVKFKILSFQKVEKRLQKLPLELSSNKDFIGYVKEKEENLRLNSSLIKVLALRGSTADYSFYAPLMRGAYNLGLTSSDLFSCYHLYMNNRVKLKNLETIILFSGVFVPGYSLQHTNEKWRAVTYKYFFNIPYSNVEIEGSKYEKFIIRKCKNHRKNNSDRNEWGYMNPTFFHETSAEQRFKGHIRENKRKPSQLFWLSELAKQLKKDSRKLVVVFPPYRSDYKKLLLDSKSLFDEILAINDIQFIDFTNADFLEDSDFGDTEHLRLDGAKKITRRLNDILDYTFDR